MDLHVKYPFLSSSFASCLSLYFYFQASSRIVARICFTPVHLAVYSWIQLKFKHDTYTWLIEQDTNNKPILRVYLL